MSFLFASEAIALGILDGNEDDPLNHESNDDPFAKAFRERELEHGAGIDFQKFEAETANVDETYRQHYLSLAKAAEVASPKVNDATLAKRASGQFQKSENGKWLYEFDASGSLISGREIA